MTRPSRGVPPQRRVNEHLGKAEELLAEVDDLLTKPPGTPYAATDKVRLLVERAQAHIALAVALRPYALPAPPPLPPSPYGGQVLSSR